MEWEKQSGENELLLLCKRAAVLGCAMKGGVEKEINDAVNLFLIAKDNYLNITGRNQGELDFLKDRPFQGFQLKNGILMGDITKIPPIACNLYRSEDRKKHQIGVLLIQHYIENGGLDNKKKGGTSKFRGVKNFLYGLLKKLK